MATLPWSLTPDEIQSAFFRVGPRARLWIDPCVDDGVLRWRFDFMDLGFCHSIEDSVPIAAIPGYGHDAAAFVFGGRYRAFVCDWHASMLGPPCGCLDCGPMRPESGI